MIGGIVLKALLLCGILFLVARHEANFTIYKVVGVTCFITLGSFAMEAFLAPALAEYMPFLAAVAVTFLVAAAIATLLVVRFCGVRLWKAIVINILFLGLSVGLSFVGVLITAKISRSVEKAGGTKIEQNHGLMSLLATSSRAETVAPPAPQPVAEQPADQLPAFAHTPEWQRAQAKIKVSAVLVERDGRHTAMVNGQVLGVGDVLAVEIKNKLYRFKMADITTDWVAWDPLEDTDSD